jgi:molybdenum cofactor biosynthesis enzyme
VLTVAQLAGVMAAKKTAELILSAINPDQSH